MSITNYDLSPQLYAAEVSHQPDHRENRPTNRIYLGMAKYLFKSAQLYFIHSKMIVGTDIINTV